MATAHRPLRWGVLSTARIGTRKVVPAMQRCELGRVTAIASRDLALARAEADRLGIEAAYGSYDDLLADPDVDAVYNPLPNHLHVPWTLRALEAGKHVLCEKPVALGAAEARDLLAAAAAHPDLVVMEAFMYRFHPQWVRARELVTSGALGRLRTVQSFFSYFNDDPADVRNIAEYGGGGLLDIGCYPVSLSRWLFGEEPLAVAGTLELDPRFGTDRLATGTLRFAEGVATFTCSTQLHPFQRVHVVGEEGRYEIEIPFNAPPDRPTRAWLHTAAGTEDLVFPVCDQYTLQADAFAAAVLDGRPAPTPLTDAVANLAVLDALVRAGTDGTWVAP